MIQNELFRFALNVLEELNLPYMVVGSFASYAYGEPRFTQDIDIVLQLRDSNAAALCKRFPPPEFYVSEPAVRDAIRTNFPFNVLHTSSGNKIDFILPRTDDWGKLQLSRRQKILLLPDREGYAASPEDVILGKIWYYDIGGSEKHLRDIAGILRISGDHIDRNYIDEWAAKLGYGSIWKMIQDREHEKPDSSTTSQPPIP